MRRKPYTIFLALTLANALSLANFQQVTLIPTTCASAYNSQIPSCTVNDFTNGCSKSCKNALKVVAESVSVACSDIIVSSNTLMGIVKNGGIIQALCPADTTNTQSVVQPTPAPSPVTTGESPPDSVTLPTGNPGVTGGGGVKTSTPSTFSKTTSAESISTSSTRPVSSTQETSSSETTSLTVASTSATSANGGLGDTTSTTTANPTPSKGTSPTSKSSSVASTPTPTKKLGSSGSSSGGGSPFDITSGSNCMRGSPQMGSFVVAVWTFILFGR